MEKEEIRKQVDNRIRRWYQSNATDASIKFSPGAIEFICLMIQNIKDDKSNYWNSKPPDFSNFDNAQKQALTLIPEMLDELSRTYNYVGRSLLVPGVVIISSWEIWHSLSPLLKKFCFIPKDV